MSSISSSSKIMFVIIIIGVVGCVVGPIILMSEYAIVSAQNITKLRDTGLQHIQHETVTIQAKMSPGAFYFLITRGWVLSSVGDTYEVNPNSLFYALELNRTYEVGFVPQRFYPTLGGSYQRGTILDVYCEVK